VFPRSCAGCRDGPWPFCDLCRASLEPLVPPWCTRCGAPSLHTVSACHDCPPPPIASVRAAFRYEGAAREAVLRLKFSGWRDVAAAFAKAIAACDGLPTADVITWVPLGRRRLADRGYDQARALAGSLGRELGLPVARLLRRTTATTPQARRSGIERRAAVRGAFSATRRPPDRVLLIDDVFTTGATAASCAGALSVAGAGTIHVVVAARAVGRPTGRLRPSSQHAYPRVGPRPGLWLPEERPR
jgi:ComF family protein